MWPFRHPTFAEACRRHRVEAQRNPDGDIVALNIQGRPDAVRPMRRFLGEMPRLERLAASDSGIDDAFARALRCAATMRVMWMRGARIGDTGLSYLRAFRSLEDLSIEGSHVTDAGLAHLAGCQRLERLGLAGCRGVTAHGLRHLRDVTALRWLSLRGLTLAGRFDVDHVIDVEWLDLGQTWSSDEQLVGIERMRRLRWVLLDGTNVTDRTIRALASIPTILDIGCLMTSVSRDTIQAIKAARPEIRFR